MKLKYLELQKLQDKINGYALNKIMDLAYTALIDRYYGNADLIEKTLSVLFDIKVKEIQDQPLSVTYAMFSKLVFCEDFQACLRAFTGALH